ncbi:hypothetical protein EYC98_12085 [Halieaceae bacterium IMCC14734]|uniref:SnoaL-like domain-containing protein n=1 Tax=Candidatus Litorirhabdus singularis TaxID=2518993 RepID=A0ABT3TJQ1_9GAMM|nr:nuclear transport factor 2 family protein [Candidatus Litorirhabdus singularis]MCX2981602.1 hypothetical protein [Candidatus Litorirhabdus singularis]
MVGARSLLIGLLLLVSGCAEDSNTADRVEVHDYPEFKAWVDHSVEPHSEMAAAALLNTAQAFANLDEPLLNKVLARNFQQHDPMLAPGREGLLALAGVEGHPRGGAPNIMEDTALLLYDPPWLVIHRGGRLGPLRSHNFDLLQFSDSGKWQAYLSYLQPLEAGWLDNLLFSFVVPRQLDLIPSQERQPQPLWLGRTEYSARFTTTAAETNLNRELVRSYLDGLQQNAEPVRELVERYLAPEFQLHLPGIPAGRESLVAMLERAQRRPGAITVQLVLAQHDLVWILSRVQEIREADIPVLAAADLFRVRNGMIVEQWKVVQPVPRFANNKNGLFPRPLMDEME